MAFAREAVVYHAHPVSVWEYWRRKFQYAFWRTRVYARYPGRLARDSRTPQSQRLQGVLAALMLFLVLLLPFVSVAPFILTFAFFLFLATNAPFGVRYFSRDWRAALIAPLLILGAAYAGDAGVAWGLVRNALNRKERQEKI